MISGCATITKDTVRLSTVTEEQTVQLQKSHIQFIQKYYQKLREDVDEFINEKWIPSFLSKTIQNKEFRKDLDDAYLVSTLDLNDVEILIKGKPAVSPYKEALISGVDQSVNDQRSRLGNVLLQFSQACQDQINKKREELITPINEQESIVIVQINNSYAELQSAQATIKAYMQSALDVKDNQEILLKKLGILQESEQFMDSIMKANEKISDIIGDEKSADEVVTEYKKKMKEIMDKIKKAKSKYL